MQAPAETPPGAAPFPAGTPPQDMAGTVLFVDDEPNILSALRRLFRSSGHNILLATGGPEALEVLASRPVDIVVSDMRMPGMDGAQLLERVRERWPHVTRVLLTGYAEVSSTISAINRGEIYRYITKPWNDDELLLTIRRVFERRALEVEKHRLELLTARQNDELKQLNANLEQRVIERTEELSKANDRVNRNYLTSIKVFSNLIELRGGSIVGHSRRVADLARRTATSMGLDATAAQDVFVAGLLHDIGHIALSDELLARPVPRMSADDLASYRRHPVLGEQSLLALEDMQRVAGLIRAHHERFDGQGFPDALCGAAIPIGARILAVADAFDDLQTGHLGSTGLTSQQAKTLIEHGRTRQFDPDVVTAFLGVIAPLLAAAPPRLMEVNADGLRAGMVLGRELRSREGLVLLAADHVLTADLIRRIRSYAEREDIGMTLHVRADAALAGA